MRQPSCCHAIGTPNTAACSTPGATAASSDRGPKWPKQGCGGLTQAAVFAAGSNNAPQCPWRLASHLIMNTIWAQSCVIGFVGESGSGSSCQPHSVGSSKSMLAEAGSLWGILRRMMRDRSKSQLLLVAGALLLLATGHGVAQQTKAPAALATGGPPPAAAADIANFFSQVGNRIYEYCIFELSEEQLEVQHALIEAYIKQGATSALARQLAIKQIRPPELSDECKQLKNQAKVPPTTSVATPWHVTTRKSEVALPKA